jgi:hypothetical protein
VAARPARTPKSEQLALDQPPRSSPTHETSSEPESFADLDREDQDEWVWGLLFGEGAIEKDAAVRNVADGLRDEGLVEFKRLRRDGNLYREILSSIERGLRSGTFDRPRRGFIRAIRKYARDYSPDAWKICLLASLGTEPTERSDAIRAAAEWARENTGLVFNRLRKGGVIEQGLESAIDSAVREGVVEVVDGGRIRGVVS